MSLFRNPNLGPMFIVALVVAVLYVPLMVWANYGSVQRALGRGVIMDCPNALACTFKMRSPVLPSPAQLALGIKNLNFPINSPTSIPVNAGWTAMETIVGLILAAIVGLFCAIALVLSRAFERSVLPWLVASQTIPIVAISPTLAVVLGQYGVQGWVPKALIAAYIAFFPIAIGVAKGLRSPDRLTLDLMKTYNATDLQTYSKLRFPASIPYLFTAFKVSMAAALIGAIVGEMSTISFQGIGKMLAENARASDIVATWVIMFASALLGILLVTLVGVVERLVTPWRR